MKEKETNLQLSKKRIIKLNLWTVAVMLIILCSCQGNNTTSEPKLDGKKDLSAKDLYDKEYLYSLIKKGINDGDTIAYKEAFEYTLINGGSSEFYYYAQLMATKHNYKSAYEDLYRLLTREGIAINGIEIYSADENTQHLANFYLIKAYELGSKSARSLLIEIFGEKIPSSKDYMCE